MTDPFSLIDDYLQQQLSIAERTSFERILAQDEDLAEAVSARKRLNAAIANHRPDLRKMMEEIQEETALAPSEKAVPVAISQRSIGKRTRLMLLFSGLLLSGLLYWWLTSSGESSTSAPAQEVPVLVKDGPLVKAPLPADTTNTTAEEPVKVIPKPTVPKKGINENKDSKKPASIKRPANKQKIYASLAKKYAREKGELFYSELNPVTKGGRVEELKGELIESESAKDTTKVSNLLEALSAEAITAKQLLARGYLRLRKGDFVGAQTDFSQIPADNYALINDAEFLKLTALAGQLPKSGQDYQKQLQKVIAFGGKYAEGARALDAELP